MPEEFSGFVSGKGMIATARSLVLITVDCLRADHAGFLGYSRPTTPFLDSLARESLVFSNAIVAGAPTYYSFPAIMASRHPLALGRDVIGLAPEEPTLASTLKQAGYATAAFLAGNPYLSARFGYSGGFDTFQDNMSMGGHEPVPNADQPAGNWKARLNRTLSRISHQLGPVGSAYDELYFQYCQHIAADGSESWDRLRRYPAGDVIVDQACAWLKTVRDKPVFLWLHFMDPHAPYYPPEQALQQMGSKITASRARYLNSYWNRGDVKASRLKKYLEEIVCLYDAGIRWVDTQVARLMDTLRSSRPTEDCVLALTADHGEEFLEHGDRYHALSKVTEELVHVPLLVHAPAIGKPGSTNEVFSLLHLAPTLLESVDVAAPISFRGRKYWSEFNRREIEEDAEVIECVSGCPNPFRVRDRSGPRRLAVRESRFKLVIDFGSCEERLFDLQNDPVEMHPLPVGQQSEARCRLLRRARQHLADTQQSRDFTYRLSALSRDWRLEWAESDTAGGRSTLGGAKIFMT